MTSTFVIRKLPIDSSGNLARPVFVAPFAVFVMVGWLDGNWALGAKPPMVHWATVG